MSLETTGESDRPEAMTFDFANLGERGTGRPPARPRLDEEALRAALTVRVRRRLPARSRRSSPKKTQRLAQVFSLADWHAENEKHPKN